MFCNDWKLIIWEHIRTGQHNNESWSAALTRGNDGNGRGLNIPCDSHAEFTQDFPGKVYVLNLCKGLARYKHIFWNFFFEELQNE